MKSILIKIKNLIPYLILISIYFFFVNIEAKKDLKNNKPNKIQINENINNSSNNSIKSRISIPVIPYSQ